MSRKDQERRFLKAVCSRCERHTEVCPVLKKPCIDTPPLWITEQLSPRANPPDAYFHFVEMWHRLLDDAFRRINEERRRPKNEH